MESRFYFELLFLALLTTVALLPIVWNVMVFKHKNKKDAKTYTIYTLIIVFMFHLLLYYLALTTSL